MKTMNRWWLSAVGRENLRYESVPVPTPKPHDVLVEVRALTLNYHDMMVIEKGLDFPAGGLIPGSDMCGIVVATGDNVSRFVPGDRVISCYIPDWIDGDRFSPARTTVRGPLGGAHQGVFAECVCLDEEWLVHAPSSVSDAQAASLPCAGLTAWFALVEKGHLKAGDTVLVHGTGGVALSGVQIALAHGARVIVVSGSDEKIERARRLGVHVGINRNGQDWVEGVAEATKDAGADHVLETVGGANLGLSLKVTAEGGRVSLIGVFEGYEFSGGFPDLARRHLVVEGIGVGHRRGLEDLVKAVEVAGISPVIEATYALADLPAALAHLDRGPFGKIALAPVVEDRDADAIR